MLSPSSIVLGRSLFMRLSYILYVQPVLSHKIVVFTKPELGIETMIDMECVFEREL